MTEGRMMMPCQRRQKWSRWAALCGLGPYTPYIAFEGLSKLGTWHLVGCCCPKLLPICLGLDLFWFLDLLLPADSPLLLPADSPLLLPADSPLLLPPDSPLLSPFSLPEFGWSRPRRLKAALCYGLLLREKTLLSQFLTLKGGVFLFN